jgi:hypothetical protein
MCDMVCFRQFFSTCTVETVCCFLPQCGQLKKHDKNQIKSKKTWFFLFLFCFLTVFLICTFVQNYNHTGRKKLGNHSKSAMKMLYLCGVKRMSGGFVSCVSQSEKNGGE